MLTVFVLRIEAGRLDGMNVAERATLDHQLGRLVGVVVCKKSMALPDMGWWLHSQRLVNGKRNLR